jgi:hypothetical protein
MTEFRKVHKFKKTAEGHLYKLKKLGNNGRIVIENTDGKTVYVVVYTLEE